MNRTDKRYTQYAISNEMLETAGVVKSFSPAVAEPLVHLAKKKKGIFFTGEGSSRIFPAKRAMAWALRHGKSPFTATDGATQALEYKLNDYAVFGASNSGKTKELVRLFTKLRNEKHDALTMVTANNGTPLQSLSHATVVLSCGKEDAVAATKSVIEQALVYDAAMRSLMGNAMTGLSDLGSKIEKVLTLAIDPAITDALKKATKIYFAGRNTGVAEELTLKTNEITRKKSAYLEGTYAVHGIEEVMDKTEAVIIVNPFEQEEEKFEECLVKGVGMTVVAIAAKKTRFPTIVIPEMAGYDEYIELAGGWNLLIEIGTALGVNLDKPVRARKIGNEFIAAA